MPERLDVSLNEVEMLAMKAARGAGLAWGVAEDTGRAAAWLARRMTDWASALRGLLACPQDATSPLLIAGWLADREAAGQESETDAITHPLWALPALLSIPRHPVTVEIGGHLVSAGEGETPRADAPIETLAARPRATIRVRLGRPAAALPHALDAAFHRGSIAAADWQALNALAARTYVEATERSRSTGAGPADGG